MAASKSNDNLVFDYRTLRLIVGAIAVSLPCFVFLIAKYITTSISASYHTDGHDVFVGFLFIIGALLVSYSGHVQRDRRDPAPTFWKSVVRYQEDIVSTIGGAAAFVVALFPTTCDTCTADWVGTTHYAAAIVVFSTVVYFCMVAFLRRLNEKLLGYEKLSQSPELLQAINVIRGTAAPGTIGFWRRLRNFSFRQSLIFLQIVREVARQNGLSAAVRRGAGLTSILPKTKDVLLGHGKKIARGYVYLVCGVLITVVLAALLLALVLVPAFAKEYNLSFWGELLALWAFGVAWMTASKLPFLRKIHLYRLFRRQAEHR